jgi:hypothetical protein
MTTTTINYVSVDTITITQTSLADGGYRSSAAVDNTTNKYMDALVGGLTQIGAVAADGTFSVYAYGSFDGTNYTAGLDGADGTITWGTTPSTTGADGYLNLPLLGTVSVDTAEDNKDVRWGPFSIAAAFGGVMPKKWGIVIKNSTGISFHATGTNNTVKFQGVKYDAA